MSEGFTRRAVIRALLVATSVFVSNFAVIGCRQNTHVAVDLVDAWPSALVATEPTVIDIGTPDGRKFLRGGWYYDEVNRLTGESFAWSRGTASVVEFHLGWRRDLRLSIRARSFHFRGADPQILNLELNSHPIARLELKPSFHDYQVTLPADFQIAGSNTLLASYGRVDAPTDVTPGSTDARELAAAWSEIRLETIDNTQVILDSASVVLPSGARVDFFLDIEADSIVEIDHCEMLGPGEGSLELSALGEGEDEPTTSLYSCSGGPLSFRMGSPPGLTRLRLNVLPGSDTREVGGVRIDKPVIRGPTRPTDRATPVPTRVPARSMGRPNVIVYLVDALRADRLGVYGGDRGLSPHLDAMAASSITFTDMIAQSSWTKAAVASIFTGQWPREHGVNGPDDRLPEELPTLPELLRADGYRTGAVVANAYVGRPFGFARGFDHFEFIEHTRGSSDVLHTRVSSWLRDLPADDRPFFLYIHTIDPHAPYAPPAPFLGRFAGSVRDPGVGQVETVRGLVLGTVEPSKGLARDLSDLYDGEVAANDHSFGDLLNELAALDELENTVVVFTSDHGEAFGEHGSWTHGIDLYNEVLAIPLVVRLPNGAGGGQRAGSTAQHIDLLPTLLDLTGAEIPDGLHGAVLVDAAGRVGVGEDRTVFSYLDYWGRKGATALQNGWKVIEPMSADFGAQTELYRYRDDPRETYNLIEDNPVRSGWLLAQMAMALRTEGVGRRTEVDSKTREQLEALGYIE